MKKYSKLMAILLVVAMLLPGIAQAAPAVTKEDVHYVTVMDLNLRSKNDDTASPVVFVPEGSKVLYKGEATSNGYFKLEYEGKVGYALRGDVTSEENYNSDDKTIHDVKLAEKSNGKSYRVVQNISLRTGNGNQYRSVQLMKRDGVVKHLGTTANNWFKVSYEGQEGYVYRGDVTGLDSSGSDEIHDIELVEKANNKTYVAIVDLALRTGNGKQYKAIGLVERGQEVTHLGATANGWFKVDFDGTVGYVYRGDLTSRANYDDLHEDEEVEGDLQVESVSAITATEVKVEIAELAKDLKDANVVVKDAAGKVVATVATDLNAGATEATFAFVTPLTVSATEAWTVDGVKYVPATFEIVNVETVTQTGKYINVQFNSPIASLDASEISVRAKLSQQAYGVEEVRLSSDRMSAQVTLLGNDTTSNILRSGIDYTLSITKNGKVSTMVFELPGVATEARVIDYNETNKTITVAGAGKLTVASNIAVDYESIVGRDINVWFDKNSVITRLVVAEQDVKYDAVTMEIRNGVQYVKLATENKEYTVQIAQPNKPGFAAFEKTKDGYVQTGKGSFDYAKVIFNAQGEIKTIAAIETVTGNLLVESVAGTVVKAYGSEFNLNGYKIVKDGATVEASAIKAGDTISYSVPLKTAVVYKAVVTGNIEAVYNNEVKVNGKTYKTSAAKYVKDGKVEVLDNDGLAELEASKKPVTLYFNHRNILTFVTGELGEVLTSTTTNFLTKAPKVYDAKATGYVIMETFNTDGKEVTEDFQVSKLETVTVGSTTHKVDYLPNVTSTSKKQPANTAGAIKSFGVDTDGTVTSISEKGALYYTLHNGTNVKIASLTGLTGASMAQKDIVEITRDDKGTVVGLKIAAAASGSPVASGTKVTDKTIAGLQVKSSTPIFVYTDKSGSYSSVSKTTWGEIDPSTSEIKNLKVYANAKGTDVAYMIVKDLDIVGAQQFDNVETVVSSVSYDADTKLAALTVYNPATSSFEAVEITKTTTDSITGGTTVIKAGDIVSLKVAKGTLRLDTITAVASDHTGSIDTSKPESVQISENFFTLTTAGGDEKLYFAGNGSEVNVFEVVETGTGSAKVTTVEKRNINDLVNLKADNNLNVSLLGSSTTYVDTIVITKNKDAAGGGITPPPAATETYIVDAFSAGFGRVTLEKADGTKTNFLLSDFASIKDTDGTLLTVAEAATYLTGKTQTDAIFVEVSGNNLKINKEIAAAPSVQTKFNAIGDISSTGTHTLVFSKALNQASRDAVKAMVDNAVTANGTSTKALAWGADNKTLTLTIGGTVDSSTNKVEVAALTPGTDFKVTDLAGNNSAALAVGDLQN